MDYDDALRWLFTLPDFERTGEFADRPDVEPARALLRELEDPHRSRPTIHIAGSKGKGSTGAMVEAILRAAGLRTGHYISPHLHRYTERIRLSGAPIAPDAFATSLAAVRGAIASVSPRFPGRAFVAFDALTAAAFLAFREADVEVQIIEVGLGGLLDSTNVFHDPPTPDDERPTTNDHTCVITPISLEHTAVLGGTIPEIARQKAGVITPGCTVVVAPQRESALDVFREVAAGRGVRLVEVPQVCQMSRKSADPDGQDFRLKTARGTYAAHLPLAGRHQLENAATAIVACEVLAEHLDLQMDSQAVRDGLASLKWPGRLETLRTRPRVIVDGAHNGDSAKRLVAALRDDFGLNSAVVLFGTLAGKDIVAMADAIAGFAETAVVTGWPSARAADPREMAAACTDRSEDLSVQVYGSLPEAYQAAVTLAGERGAVVCFGSIAFVAAVREHILGIESDALRLALSARQQ